MSDGDAVSRLDEVLKRCDNATAGPWEYADVESIAGGSFYGNGWMLGSVDWANDLPRHSGSPLLDSDFRTTKVADRNGEFIAASRTDLPDLARDFRTVAEALREVWEACERAVNARIEPRSPAMQITDAWLGVPDEWRGRGGNRSTRRL